MAMKALCPACKGRRFGIGLLSRRAHCRYRLCSRLLPSPDRSTGMNGHSSEVGGRGRSHTVCNAINKPLTVKNETTVPASNEAAAVSSSP